MYSLRRDIRLRSSTTIIVLIVLVTTFYSAINTPKRTIVTKLWNVT